MDEEGTMDLVVENPLSQNPGRYVFCLYLYSP
jgi:hypothetical protein